VSTRGERWQPAMGTGTAEEGPLLELRWCAIDASRVPGVEGNERCWMPSPEGAQDEHSSSACEAKEGESMTATNSYPSAPGGGAGLFANKVPDMGAVEAARRDWEKKASRAALGEQESVSGTVFDCSLVWRGALTER